MKLFRLHFILKSIFNYFHSLCKLFETLNVERFWYPLSIGSQYIKLSLISKLFSEVWMREIVWNNKSNLIQFLLATLKIICSTGIKIDRFWMRFEISKFFGAFAWFVSNSTCVCVCALGVSARVMWYAPNVCRDGKRILH